MQFFGGQRTAQIDPSRTALSRLRETLQGLEHEEETPQIVELRRILAGRIAEMERKAAL